MTVAFLTNLAGSRFQQLLIRLVAVATLLVVSIHCNGSRCFAQSTDFDRSNLELLIEAQKKTMDALRNGISTGRNPMTGETMSADSLDGWRRLLEDQQKELSRRQNRLNQIPKPPVSDGSAGNRSNRGNNTSPNSRSSPKPGQSTRPFDMDVPSRPRTLPPSTNPGGLLDQARDAARGLRNRRVPPISPQEVAFEAMVFVVVDHEIPAILAVNEAWNNEESADAMRKALDHTIRDKVREIHEDPARRQSLNQNYSLDQLQTLAVINSHQNQGVLTGLMNNDTRQETLNALKDLNPDAVDWRKAVRDEMQLQAVEILDRVKGVVGAVAGDVQAGLEKQAQAYIFGDPDRGADTLAAALMEGMESLANRDSTKDVGTESAGGGNDEASAPPAGDTVVPVSPAGPAQPTSPGGTTGQELPGNEGLLELVANLNRNRNNESLVPKPAADLLAEPPIPDDPIIEVRPPLVPVVPNVPGSAGDFAGHDPNQVTENRTPVQPPINFGDVDLNQFRVGMNQLIADLNARANFRTDADRQQASNLEGQLRSAEEAWRRQVERYNRLVQQRVNEALQEQQRLRVQAAHNHWLAQQQALQSYYQQHTPVAPGHGQGHKNAGEIKDHE